MADEYVHNSPRDLAEERFEWLEVKVTHISHNMNLLIVDLEINLRPFRDYGGSNSEIGSEGKSGDREDLGKNLWKESKKD
jgi:hypothetical protein